METRDLRLTHWRVIDTFRLREGCAHDWRAARQNMAISVAPKRYALTVDASRAAFPSWRRWLRYIVRFSG